MTLQALQEYLDVVKWKNSEKIRADMCGRYARCRYCNRTEDYPCARAHNRLVEMQSSPVPDHIPEWLLPEPPVKEQFGEELADEESAEPVSPASPVAAADKAPETADEPQEKAEGQAALGEAPVSAQETPAAQFEEAEAAPESTRLIDRPRPHVIMRGAKGDTRVCFLQRKLPTVSDAVSEQ